MRARPVLAWAVMLDALGNGDEALDVLARADARLAVPSWNRPLLGFAKCVTLYRRGEWDDALVEAEAALVGAEETDLKLGVGWPYAIGTAIALARGDRSAARARGRHGPRRARRRT